MLLLMTNLQGKLELGCLWDQKHVLLTCVSACTHGMLL